MTKRRLNLEQCPLQSARQLSATIYCPPAGTLVGDVGTVPGVASSPGGLLELLKEATIAAGCLGVRPLLLIFPNNGHGLRTIICRATPAGGSAEKPPNRNSTPLNADPRSQATPLTRPPPTLHTSLANTT